MAVLSPKWVSVSAVVRRPGIAVALAASSLFWLLLPGCSGAHGTARPNEAHWVAAYGFGVWGTAEFDIRDDCPSGVAENVRVGPTWTTLLVSLVTLGLYTPREVRVRCGVAR